MSKRSARTRAVTSILVAGWLIWGCQRKEDSPKTEGGPSTSAASTATQNADASAGSRPVGVDRQDDPEAPRAIPKTHELHGWAKSEPVRVLPTTSLDDVIEEPNIRAAISTFPLRRISRCAYQQKKTTAKVLFIEADTPEDAFGVFSMMTPTQGRPHPDGTIRTVQTRDTTTTEPGNDWRVVINGWQGNAVAQVRFTSTGGDNPDTQECDRLISSVLFNVPSAEAPWLLRAIQNQKAEASKLWLVRSTAALKATGLPEFSRLDPKVMDSRLGLAGPELLTVALVRVADDETPNLIWLARYGGTASAQAAAERYQKCLQSPDAGMDADTILDEPKGPFLAGSWTAGQESIQNLLPKLRTILPD